jgi:hypothetical protein
MPRRRLDDAMVHRGPAAAAESVVTGCEPEARACARPFSVLVVIAAPTAHSKRDGRARLSVH